MLTAFVSTLLLGQGTQIAVPAESAPVQALFPQGKNGEFPFFDDQAWSAQRKGLSVKAASRLRIEQPGSPQTLLLLSELDRYEEAMQVLRHIVENHPDRIAEAFTLLKDSRLLITASRGEKHPLPDFATPLRSVLVEVHERLPQITQGEALRIARAALPVVRQLPRREELTADFTAFIARHATGDEALLEEVSRLVLGRPIAKKIETLEDFARKHPGTVASARALYQVGFDLSYNGAHVGFEPRRGDPTARFMRLAQIVRELESGVYPSCEWTKRAPSLFVGFHAYEATYAPGNVERMLKTYEEFLVTQFKLEQQDPFHNPIINVLTGQMLDLFNLNGEGMAGVERVFTKQQSSQPAGVQLLKARFYIELMREASGDERTRLLEKGLLTLQAIYRQSNGLHQRLALATLASVYFHERDYGKALDSYRQYLKLSPEADWAWVAALRVGECHEQLNDLPAAFNAFGAAAESYRSVPVAAVLANSSASAAAEALGRVSDALRTAKQTLEAWDNDYGQWYHIEAIQARRETDIPFASSEPTGARRR